MPAIEYTDLELFIASTPHLSHLDWTTEQMVQATIIIAKIRGQLRPLRHGGFDLNEFRFANVRNSVPTELRPFVLQSWHNIIDPSRQTPSLLADLWHIASLVSVSEGRNIPLYQYHDVLPYLVQKEMQQLSTAIEHGVQRWATSLPNPTLCVRYEIPSPSKPIPPLTFDILSDTTIYQLYFDSVGEPTADEKIILLVKIYLYTLEFPGISEMGFINMATGTVYTYPLSKETFAQAAQLWAHMKRKYAL